MSQNTVCFCGNYFVLNELCVRVRDCIVSEGHLECHVIYNINSKHLAAPPHFVGTDVLRKVYLLPVLLCWYISIIFIFHFV